MPYYKYIELDANTKNWGNAEFKYFSNEVMRYILKDIENVVSGGERQKQWKKFLQYFAMRIS